MKSKFFVWFLVFALLGNSSGIAYAQDRHASKAQMNSQSVTGTITLWHDYAPPGGAEETALNQVILNAQTANPGLTIDATYHLDLLADYNAAIQSGSAPDMYLGSSDWVGDQARAGNILNIDSYLTGNLTNVTLAAINGNVVDGLLYGIPKQGILVALYYNKSTLPTPPTTTAELLSMLQNDGKSIAGAGDAGSYFYYGFWDAFGGQLMDGTGRCTADQGGYDLAMQYLRDLQTAGASLATDYASAETMFLNGNVDMLINGPWTLANYEAVLGADLGVAILPSGPSGVAHVFTDSVGFYVNPNTANPADVVNLALYMTNQASSQIFTDVGGDIPVRTDVSSADSLINAFAQIFAQGNPRPKVQQMFNYWDPFNKMVINVLTGIETPQVGVQRACNTMNVLNGFLPIVSSITRTFVSPSSLSSVNFTVTFSKPVTGVDSSDFSLTTSGVLGASITSVTPVSGTTYTVTVDTGSGNGTIRLDVADNNSIVDAASNPLGGAAIGDGDFTSGEVYTIKTAVETYIGGVLRGSYLLGAGESTRQNYVGVDSGPVKVVSTDGTQIVSAIREAWAVNGVTTSFFQMMGLPQEQLSDTYVFPGYNNVTLNEQLRISNVDTVPSTVTVTIGGVLRGTYPLAAGEAVRINYAGLDSGPVIVQGTSGVKIISAIREAWAVNGVTKSFVQLMGLPKQQLSDKYVFPGYNNVTLNEQLRIGNVDSVASTVTVTIGGVLRGTYILQPNEAVRVNYAGVDSGPVIVQGTAGVKIISAIREAWAVNGVTTSFAQLMGLPSGQLSNKYVFPGYNNVTLNDQLRIGNVDSVQTTVTVTIGGVLRGSYTLQPNEAVRVNYAGLDSGPVVVEGSVGVKIISAIREAWAVNGVTTSFTQLMGLPFEQLSSTFWFPAYNNVTLNEQIRIAVP